MQMQIPCRSSTCEHLQCFDGWAFILMNEKKPSWICPICDRPAKLNSLVVDGSVCSGNISFWCRKYLGKVIVAMFPLVLAFLFRNVFAVHLFLKCLNFVQTFLFHMHTMILL